MGSLIWFEIKKILSGRVLQISFGAVLALLCLVLFLIITSQYALDPSQVDKDLRGTSAIAQIRANESALAGPITDQRTTEDLREYKTFLDPDGEV